MIFKEDLKKYYIIEFNTPAPPLKKKISLWLFNWGVHCVAVYRFGRFTERLRKGSPILGLVCSLFSRILYLLISFMHHVEINAQIGPGFYIGHAANIYIGPSKIGSNFSVTHNVTIGIGHGKVTRGIPIIGNNVWVGTGAVLFGDVVLGDGVTVMSGTILSKDVPDSCLVGGNPGRIVKRNYDNKILFNGYYHMGEDSPEATR